jgi:hypothetical protein
MSIVIKPAPIPSDRNRISFEVSPAVSSLLDHVSEVTGANKSQVALSALLDALPSLLERAESLQKRSVALTQPQAQKRR